MMMVLTLITIMVEMGIVVEITLVFAVEPVMIVVIISPVAIMSVPCGIRIIRISRIGLFVDTN